MANENGSNTGMAFIVGALVVVVAILAWLFLWDGDADVDGDTNVTVEVPEATDGDGVVEEGAEAATGDGG